MNHDPTDIHGQDRTKAEQARSAKLARETEEGDFKWLMSSKRGRRIAWSLMDRAGVFRLSFHTNSMQMAFNEGTRNEGLRLLAMINTNCPELYQAMIEEQKDERNTDDGTGCNDHGKPGRI